MEKEKTIKFYQVSCGLYALDSLFPPFANVSGDFIQDLDKAIELYESISVDSFCKAEVLEAKREGLKTYNKTIVCAEMPISIYEDWCLVDDFGKKLSPEQTQERINDCVWHHSVKFLNNVKDQLFEIKGVKKLSIVNLRDFVE